MRKTLIVVNERAIEVVYLNGRHRRTTTTRESVPSCRVMSCQNFNQVELSQARASVQPLGHNLKAREERILIRRRNTGKAVVCRVSYP